MPEIDISIRAISGLPEEAESVKGEKAMTDLSNRVTND